MGVHRLHAENAKKLLDRTHSDLNYAILVYFTSENKMAARMVGLLSLLIAASFRKGFTPLRDDTLIILSLHFCLTKVKLLPPALTHT